MILRYRVTGLPFATLTNHYGVVCYSGNPAARNIEEDIYQLMNGLMIFETIDKEEDPEAPRKDAREDLEKNIQLGEDKKVKKYLKHEYRKMEHFFYEMKE